MKLFKPFKKPKERILFLMCFFLPKIISFSLIVGVRVINFILYLSDFDIYSVRGGWWRFFAFVLVCCGRAGLSVVKFFAPPSSWLGVTSSSSLIFHT